LLQGLKLNLTFAEGAYNRPMPEALPDVGSMNDQELRELIDQLTADEREISYRRRILHGRIDLLRAELVGRLRGKHREGESAITGSDVDILTDILLGRIEDPRAGDGEGSD